MPKSHHILGVFALLSFCTASYLEKVCKQPLNPGDACNSGEEPSKSYYFDAVEERCLSFSYLGCNGNDNRFNTSDACIDSCQTAWFMKKNKAEPDPDQNMDKLRQKTDCQLKPEKGPCKALITMWFFDPQSQTCKVFGYGGCKGNLNKFDTKDECDNFCTGNRSDTNLSGNGIGSNVASSG